jgi:hypothetical protein
MSLQTQLRRGRLALALFLALLTAATAGARFAPEYHRLQHIVRTGTASLDVAAVSLLGGRIRLRPAGIVVVR